MVREVPLPTLAELNGYLPSRRFPSDHLPVVFDLAFKSSQAQAGVAAAAAAVEAAGGSGGSSSGGAQGGDSDTGGGGGGARGGNGGSAAATVLPAAMYNVGLAAEALGRSQLVAVPTDTLYGLAACAKSSAAVAQIYAAKRRDDRKPLAICLADVADVAAYAQTQQLPEGLLEALLPGPVTLLLRRQAGASLAPELNPGALAIGVRVPDCAFTRALCRQHRGALALTSANISGGLSSVAVDEFRVGLGRMAEG